MWCRIKSSNDCDEENCSIKNGEEKRKEEREILNKN